jgi:hypothetical protein
MSDISKAMKTLTEMIYGYRLTQLVYVAAKLGIPDLLKDNPRTSEELARLTNTDPSVLYRVMRALSSLGLFVQEAPHRFCIAELAMPLLSDAPGTIRPVAILRGEESNWKPWAELLYALKTGENAFTHVFGTNLFDYYNANPDAAASFNETMSISTNQTVNTLFEYFDFSSSRKFVDLGGGHGHLIAALLNRYPSATGIVFDMPYVVDDARRYIESAGLAARCQVVGGNFFESIPQGADTYILRHIVHDWNDERAGILLRNCRSSMGDTGKVLLLERVVPFKGGRSVKINDVHMMLQTPGGRERTEAEFQELLTRSGFQLDKMIPSGEDSYILEGRPIG